MDLAASPLALPFPDMPAIGGVTLRSVRAGYKAWERADLTYAEVAPGTALAGVFTRNVCCSSEVEMGRVAAAKGVARALVVNAGNSNAFTGYRGRAAVEQIMGQVAAHLGCDPGEVLVCSTGVIGVPLPLDKARSGVAAALAAAPCGWEDAARTIGTTDTFAKGATVAAIVGGVRVTLNGIIKGSGMIAPDMATMLGYIFTDAAISPAFLQECLSAANAATFNCITVDSDTSTSDTVLAFATGAAANPVLQSFADPGADAFAAALHDLCRQLAQLVVRDGEGAQKFITISVTGAASDESARRIGLAIANSPLVKTAIAGGDANWGRVVMAVGKAGEPADRDRLSIAFGGIWAARDGLPLADYDEAPVAAHLAGQEVEITADLGLAEGRATVWTCDLTHGYIAINADYRSVSALDSEMLALMQRVTRDIILPRYQNLAAGEVENKAKPGERSDPVTIADKESEAALSEALAAIAPGVAIVGEEAVHADAGVMQRLSGDCWIIDPIDGTRNFASGKPPFGILIARAAGGYAQSGWIYDCLTGRLCAAHRGQGAFVNGERIAARATGENPPVAAISLVFLDADARAAMIEHIAPHYRLCDIPHCAAEQYPRLGLGENDLSLFERALAWDHAAGALWLEEAGGTCARPDGSAYRVDEWDRKGLIGAASPALWEGMAQRLARMRG